METIVTYNSQEQKIVESKNCRIVKEQEIKEQENKALINLIKWK